MSRSRAAVLSWLPAILGMAGLFYASSLPGNEIHLPPFPYSDKAVHFCAYSVLGGLISLRTVLRGRLGKGSGPGRGPGSRNFDFHGFAVGALYGVSDEIHQLFVPLRSFDFADMGADALGIAAGCWLGRRIFPLPEDGEGA